MYVVSVRKEIKLPVICFLNVRDRVALWESIKKWCSSYLILTDISVINTVTGFYSDTKTLNLENRILLLFKKFLYETRTES